MDGVFFIILRHHPFALPAVVLLLCVSATFSGCETALFSLTTPQLNRIRASNGKLDRIITALYGNLKSLLPTILFCNMAVNVMTFAIASSVTGTVGDMLGGGAAFLFSLIALFVVVFFGEVFPKQFAIAASMLVARLTAFQVYFLYRALRQPMKILNGIVSACERIVQPVAADSRELREEELRLMVELSRNDGVISDGEYELIDGVVDLPDVRIRDILVPRVDESMLCVGDSWGEAVRAARKGRHCKMPVFDSVTDDVVGWIDARDIYRAGNGEPESDSATIDSAMRRLRFFSEHDRADQVLERIKNDGGDLFAVVDERGIIIGFFTLQDIMDEVLGHFGEAGAAPEGGVRVEGDSYILPGRLSVREWRELFSISEEIEIPQSATVGGLVVSLLGRMARPGDTVHVEAMEMTVQSVWRNRVTEVLLRLRQPATSAGGKDGA